MKISKLTISLVVLCTVLTVSNVAFIIYFFNQSPPEPKEPIIIQKGKDEKITEEDVRQAMSQAVNEVREDATANETAYMGFMLTFIGTMATLTGIAFTVYNFFQVSKVRDSVEQGIKDGLDKLGVEYEKRMEEKYNKRLEQVELIIVDMLKAIRSFIALGLRLENEDNRICTPYLLAKIYFNFYIDNQFENVVKEYDNLLEKNQHLERELLIIKYFLVRVIYKRLRSNDKKIYRDEYSRICFETANRLIDLGVRLDYDIYPLSKYRDELEGKAKERLTMISMDKLLEYEKMIDDFHYVFLRSNNAFELASYNRLLKLRAEMEEENKF
jgi:hypothetical protein